MEEGALSNGSSFPVSVSAVSVTVCLRRPSAAPACASAASAAGGVHRQHKREDQGNDTLQVHAVLLLKSVSIDKH